jgi:REP element-mobilizing transposase RayT
MGGSDMRRPKISHTHTRGKRHLARPRVRSSTPVHIAIRMRKGTWNLRTKRCFRIIREAFIAAQKKIRFRLCAYSVQGNHLHLIAEADDTYAISRAMRGISIRIAKRLNRLMGTRGPVIPIRYFMRVLHTPLQIKRALAYVLNNYRRHAAEWGETLPSDWLDPYSSARWFDGWSKPPARRARGDPLPHLQPGIVPALSNVLRTTWKRFGLVDRAFVPGARANLSG